MSAPRLLDSAEHFSSWCSRLPQFIESLTAPCLVAESATPIYIEDRTLDQQYPAWIAAAACGNSRWNKTVVGHRSVMATSPFDKASNFERVPEPRSHSPAADTFDDLEEGKGFGGSAWGRLANAGRGRGVVDSIMESGGFSSEESASALQVPHCDSASNVMEDSTTAGGPPSLLADDADGAPASAASPSGRLRVVRFAEDVVFEERRTTQAMAGDGIVWHMLPGLR